MSYLRNRWYVAAWSHEVPVGGLLGRKILGDDIVVYRNSQGVPAAIGGRCAHRFAPLAKGTVVGDSVRCPYHGLEFAADGRCVRNPIGGAPAPDHVAVPSYTLAERHGALWIWTGAAPADEALIPAIGAYLDHPLRSTMRDYLHVGGHYGLVIDNLMDLTHALFLHPGTLMTAEMTDVLEISVRQDGDSVDYNINAHDVPPPSLHAAFLPVPADRIDFLVEMRWEPASYLRLTSRVRPAGNLDPAAGAQGVSAHLLTPESDTSTHYFFGASRDRILEPESHACWAAAIRFAFEHQDEPMIRAQQEMMGTEDFMALRPALLPTDAGPMRVRRLLDKLIRKEALA